MTDQTSHWNQCLMMESNQMETFFKELAIWASTWGIHRSPVNSLHKGQWRGALMYYLICAWINGGVNSREAGDLRRHCTHFDVTVITDWADHTLVPTANTEALLMDHTNWQHNFLFIFCGPNYKLQSILTCCFGVALDAQLILRKLVMFPVWRHHGHWW